MNRTTPLHLTKFLSARIDGNGTVVRKSNSRDNARKRAPPTGTFRWRHSIMTTLTCAISGFNAPEPKTLIQVLDTHFPTVWILYCSPKPSRRPRCIDNRSRFRKRYPYVPDLQDLVCPRFYKGPATPWLMHDMRTLAAQIHTLAIHSTIFAKQGIDRVHSPFVYAQVIEDDPALH